MPTINDGGQAFPSHPILYSSADAGNAQGMTLRDWFAGQALVGLLSSATFTNSGDGFEEFISIRAVNIADAMLKAREGGTP